MSPEIHFVGRETELEEFRQLLAHPYGNFRIALILGEGGIGKTQLVRRMLVEAGEGKTKILAPKEPLDLFSTEFRNIDGIQLKIIDTVENLTELKGKQSPFAEFHKENQDTSEQFNKCLRIFCAKNPLVLAFDTFENLDVVASNWLFESGNEGLQVPGLICVVAGRSKKENLERYRTNSLVKEVVLSGLTLQKADELYQKVSNDRGRGNLFEDILLAAGVEQPEVEKNAGLEWVWKITKGHPLKLEMAFRWAGVLLGEKSLIGVTAEKFEEMVMAHVREFGAQGSLDVGSLKVSQPVFDTLGRMAHITRRFDKRFLQFLIEEKYVRLDESNVDIADILDNLEKYFFVKVRIENEGKQVLQLHDEMARLVREHVWPFIDFSGEEKQRLFKAVIKFYDQLVSDENDINTKNALRIEQLYYALKSDLFGAGKRMWFDLADLDDDYFNSVLFGEIREYDEQFDPETRYEIQSRIAQIEFEAGHLTQARRAWQQVYELGAAEKRDDWIANALFSLANCERDVEQALKAYQKAMKFCKEKAPKYLPSVYYNIGFTYRRMQDIKKAIRWYRDARKQFQQNPWDRSLEAKIANDLGYAYSLLGDWEECRKNVKEGQRIRQSLFPHYELDEEVLKSKIQIEKGEGAKACFQLGLTYNTLGEIYRYDEDLDASLRNYTEALKLFRVTNSYQWQAKALYSRGETRRRIARVRHWKDKQVYDAYMKEAQEDIEESLYLCEKYRVKTERDTANRRMGRVLHDRAMRELEMGNKTKKAARELLVQARRHFEEGLKYARETNDALEELSNLAELAFIVDDFMAMVGPSRVPKEYQASLVEFERTLEAHREDKFRIYQFSVFEDLYILEKAATDYQQGKYTQALKGYVKACTGLASDPGYGRTRYKQHFPHLTEQIEKLPPTKAKTWCKTFINVWEETKDKRGRVLSEETVPDLVVWCRTHVVKIEAQKG